MAIQLKNDVSYLFSSLNNNSSSSYGINSLYSMLGDYATIKSGSYGKLMKAYYAADASDEVSSIAKKTLSNAGTDAYAKKVATAQTKVDALKTSAEALNSTEEDSVWAKGDIDEIYSAVKSYVSNYNATLESVSEVEDTNVTNRALNLINNTKSYEADLKKIGITINDDDTLSIDEETFKAAGVNAAADVFQGRGTYGYVQTAQAGILKSAVDCEAMSASTYTSSATYNTLGTSGTLFNSLF